MIEIITQGVESAIEILTAVIVSVTPTSDPEIKRCDFGTVTVSHLRRSSSGGGQECASADACDLVSLT